MIDMHGLEPMQWVLLIPIAKMAMVVAIVGIALWFAGRQRELKVHQELRIREMEHARKLKEMEIEKAKLELEKARTSKNA